MQSSCQIVAINKQTLDFLQAGWLSSHPINIVEALKGKYIDGSVTPKCILDSGQTDGFNCG